MAVQSDTDLSLTRGAVLAARGYAFVKAALAVAALALIVYLWHDPPGGAYGGTWLGYTLGLISAGLVLWLAWLGIRKRSYAGGRIDLRDWVAAHICLGVLVSWLALLHSGFSIHADLHGLVYILLLGTVLSGLWGLQAYIRYPQLVTANRGGLAFDELLGQIAALDGELRGAAMQMDEAVNRAVHSAAHDTKIGATLRSRLSGQEAGCATTAARQLVEAKTREATGELGASLRRLLGMLTRKEALLRRARRDIQLMTLLQIWLYVHVPLTCALLVGIAAHVIAVFFHW